MKKFIYLFLFLLFSYSYSQFITKWQMTAGAGTSEDLKFYISAATVGNVDFNYTVAGGTTGTIPITVNTIDPTNAQAITLTIPRTSNNTTVSISIANINSFQLVKNTLDGGGTAGVTPTDSFSTPGKLLDVTQWGGSSIVWRSFRYAFAWATNLTEITASDSPNITALGITYNQYSFPRMFADSGVTKVKGISTWNVSNILNFQGMFENARFFNDDISTWTINSTPAVNINMSFMFKYAESFNQNISLWNVSRVNSAGQYMMNAKKYNFPLPNFDFTRISNLASFLTNAQSFNQDLSNLNFSNTTNYTQAFSSTKHLSSYKGTKILNKVRLDNINKTNLSGNISLGSFSYFDPTDSWKTTQPLSPIISPVSIINLYSKYRWLPEGTLHKVDRNGDTDAYNIGIMKENNMGFEWLSEEETDGITYNPIGSPTVNYTLKRDANNDVVMKSMSFWNTTNVNSSIKNTLVFNVSSKPIVYKKGTTTPQDVSVDGTIVYDFTDNHLYVSKGGQWHRADN